jgi:hypothetical protein
MGHGLGRKLAVQVVGHLGSKSLLIRFTVFIKLKSGTPREPGPAPIPSVLVTRVVILPCQLAVGTQQ